MNMSVEASSLVVIFVGFCHLTQVEMKTCLRFFQYGEGMSFYKIEMLLKTC